MSSVVDWLKSIATKIGNLSESIASTVWNLFSSAFSTLWGWLGDIVDGIVGLPKAILDGFASFFSTLWEWLKNIFDTIVGLPKAILDGIKEIFIPDIDDIEETFNNSVSSIKNKFGFQQFHLDTLFGSSVAPENIDSNYTINGVGTLNLTFFNTEYLIKGINYFRPFIRGFLILLLIFYNIKNFLSFIGLDIHISNESYSSNSPMIEDKRPMIESKRR